MHEETKLNKKLQSPKRWNFST